MDKSFHPQRSDILRLPGPFFTALLKVFDNALQWLVGFIQLTEEEQREAGIYLDRPGGE
jgi:hypothetical protein